MDTSKAHLASCISPPFASSASHPSISLSLFSFLFSFRIAHRHLFIVASPSMCDKQFSLSPSATAPTVQPTTIHVQTNKTILQHSSSFFLSSSRTLSPAACTAVVDSQAAPCCPRRGWASLCLIQLTIPPHSEQRAREKGRNQLVLQPSKISIRNSACPVTIDSN